ncbi:hypothetical protein ACTXPA_12680 [Glutamicibacter arilaitensis]|uniref:hypothetical protein n=1 Tax=Glutamicibacter arilaitensis TaxID=256701 RepID=UPI003FD66BD9
MSARLELEKVIARHESQVGASQKLPNEWVMSQMELSAARRAAVLILFGGAGQKTLQPDSGVEDLDLLFVERAATLRKHAGQVAFPGGESTKKIPASRMRPCAKRGRKPGSRPRVSRSWATWAKPNCRSRTS